MNKTDLIQLFAPAIAALLLAVVGLATAAITGLSKKLEASLDAHQQSAAAALVSSAANALDAEMTTSANAIAGKIQAGTLDYTSKSAIEAEARREAELVAQRLPAQLMAAAPQAATVVAAIIGKVDAQLLASPTVQLEPLKPSATVTPIVKAG